MIPKPPVVAILGHIDHGKSTLLDYIRKTNVVEKEVGGITHNMSAYEVTHNGKKITFLDTPGHEAFDQLRILGAKAADIAVLIVSAEDGVKNQTIEALRAIREAKLPFIVVINKIDKEGADIERTKQSLLENEIYIEGYGGDIPSVAISAKTGQGVNELLDMIGLVNELQDKKADPKKLAEGIVLEATRDQKKGITATLLIEEGTLKSGMFVVSGETFSPVRIFEDFQGTPIKEATFSSPVRVVGFNELPYIGEKFKSFNTKKEAEEEARKNKENKKNSKALISQITPDVFYIPVVIKANTSGVIDAIVHEIKKLENEKIKARIIFTGIGDISENDVKIASGSDKTLIVGFSNKIDPLAKSQAEKLGIEIQTFEIIYKLAEWLAEIFKERTPKTEVEEEKGKIKVLKIFSKSKDKQIVGGRVEEGKINVGDDVKILRRDSEIGKGKVRELQQAKIKTSEVGEGLEFGSMIESRIEIAPGDYIRPYSLVTK